MAKTTKTLIRYSDETKQQARQMIEDLVPNAEITKKLKLGKYTLDDWRKAWRKEAAVAGGQPIVATKAAKAPAKPATDEEVVTLKQQVASLTAALKELVPPAKLLAYKQRMEAEADEAVARAEAAQAL